MNRGLYLATLQHARVYAKCIMERLHNALDGYYRIVDSQFNHLSTQDIVSQPRLSSTMAG
jgi:hypothetical protein